MTQVPYKPDETLNQFPLSFTQEFLCSFGLDDRGAFNPRFLMVCGVRITGQVDTVALRGALDDVVERHELLRTIVVRDVEPPYQQVYPPGPVPLEIVDIPPVSGKSRDVQAEELIIAAEQIPMDCMHLPLLRAVFGRFDDSDSVLVLTSHHSACDGWAIEVILRDLAAFYRSRTTGRPADLPEIPQYRQYAAWQRAELADPSADGSRAYWKEKLAGVPVFAVPNDRPTPAAYSRPYSIYNYIIDSDVISSASALGASTRSSLYVVLLAAFHVLAFQITGATDSAIRSFTSGHNDPEFQETIGPFMNLVPFRTDIAGCRTFREVVEQTRDTCIEAYENEIPYDHIELELPEFNLPHENPRMSQFILDFFQLQYDDTELRIADSSYEIHERVLPEPEHPDVPSGLVWNLFVLPSGQLNGGILYNLDEFDDETVVNWFSAYRRILSAAVSDPDQEWKTL